MAKVLFVCIHNAGRSQISRVLFDRAAAGRHESDCAGTQPATRVHPQVAEAMAEIGIDISQRRPQKLTREMAEWSDVVVTMGCGDECPYIPGKRYIDWDLPDPTGKSVAEIRVLRDEIDSRVDGLLQELNDTDGGQR